MDRGMDFADEPSRGSNIGHGPKSDQHQLCGKTKRPSPYRQSHFSAALLRTTAVNQSGFVALAEIAGARHNCCAFQSARQVCDAIGSEYCRLRTHAAAQGAF